MKPSFAAVSLLAKRSLAFVARVLDLRDTFFFGGLMLLCYGAHEVYAPAAWIIGGGVLMLVGLRGVRAKAD